MKEAALGLRNGGVGGDTRLSSPRKGSGKVGRRPLGLYSILFSRYQDKQLEGSYLFPLNCSF